jgi:hypothetical protein
MSPETRAFLAEVRAADDPTGGDEMRVLARLDAALAGSSDLAASGEPASATGVLGGASGLKLGGVLVGISAGIALAVAVLAPSPVPPRMTAAPAVTAPATLSAPAIRATPAMPSASARTPSGRLRAATPPPARAPSRETDVRPPAPTVPNAAGTAAQSQRHDARSVREELSLLTDVHAALARGDGASALRRLEAHVTEDRQFVAERAAARVLALCTLGRVNEARRAATIFVREHPGSVQRAAVERSCAGVKSGGGG